MTSRFSWTSPDRLASRGNGHAPQAKSTAYLLSARQRTRMAAPAPFSLDELRIAVESGEGLRVVAQPQFDLQTGKMASAELLARWGRGAGEEVPPSQFIPALRMMGIKSKLFNFVRLEAQNLLRTLVHANAVLPVAINASAATLSIPGLLRNIDTDLRRHGIPASLLKLEITEDTEADDILTLASELSWMRGRGFGVSMDDFGMGASTLERLTRLPFSELKIDGSFVQRMQAEPAARAVVGSSIDLGRRMGLTVVAEGVESTAHQQLLLELGCRLGQGYGLGAPMELHDFVKKAVLESTAIAS